MERRVEPEWLDELPPDDPRAATSRQDLLRLHWWMGSVKILAEVLRGSFGAQPLRVVDLGAGDGRLLSQIVSALAPTGRGSSITLLDRAPGVSEATLARFTALGWRVDILRLDILEWARQPDPPACDVVLTNLFLHHFKPAELDTLLQCVARRTRCFVALEPRRSWPALAISLQLITIGCGVVTRHDAPVSVRAGFRWKELSAAWPATSGWQLSERRIGMFGHLFVARASG